MQLNIQKLAAPALDIIAVMQAVHSHSARLAPRGRVVASQRPLTVSTRPSAPGARRKCQAAADAAEAPTGSATAAAAVEAAAASPPLVANSTPLVYKGLVFDMDGTLTVGNIDYANMRQKVNIPVGDLFTVRLPPTNCAAAPTHLTFAPCLPSPVSTHVHLHVSGDGVVG
jgi:hypothetical protein